MANRSDDAAAECSNRADLRLTLTERIRHSDLAQRPSLTALHLVCIKNVRARHSLSLLTACTVAARFIRPQVTAHTDPAP
jgi:hypothetical protein